MPKMKTKSSAKRRFSRTGTGKVKRKHAFTSHMMQNKTTKQKRQARGVTLVSDPDARIILRNFLPYDRKVKRKAVRNTQKGDA